jgi:glycosyltransferase involved in cell wall biosynthesis
MAKNLLDYSFGINIVGHVTGELGLGEAVRANIRAVESSSIPFTIRDFNSGYPWNFDTTYTNFSEDNPYPINLIQVNPDAVYRLYDEFGEEYFQGKYNIGFWFWEMLAVPDEWQSLFDLFNEIWVASNYCLEAISAVSPIPVIKVRPSMYLPKPLLGREALGLPKDKFIFLFMFDPGSGYERKNPVATIEAFKKAFGNSNQNVLLLLKSRGLEWMPEKKKQLETLAENYPIRFIDGRLAKEAVNALVYNCDCYVSLHRAEGFGLTIAEAMFYGKPAIATAYSSNMDFMNLKNSFLVGYEMIPLTENFGPYQKGNVWADPDIDQAAHLMRYVFENYERAKQVGARGAHEIRSSLNPQVVGSKIKSRLEHIISRKGRKRYNLTKEYFEYQATAWRKTAQLTQTELEQTQFLLQQAQSELQGLGD